ncbi:hypothetical protein [Bartonella sp. AD24XZML]|uniref:hypothetical protein n=1 Tax=Bartonella sp. AD24XZML TaxID=3243463 RepID=UPI0035CEEC59
MEERYGACLGISYTKSIKDGCKIGFDFFDISSNLSSNLPFLFKIFDEKEL